MSELTTFVWDNERVQCQECGSSDGFARILHPETHRVYGDDYGKCHSCGHFKPPGDQSAATYSRPPLATGFSREKLLPVMFSAAPLIKKWLPTMHTTEHMNLFMDVKGNAVFVYADVDRMGRYLKTVAYDEHGNRERNGSGDRIPGGIDMAAGFWLREGEFRKTLSSKGYYSFLFNQDSLDNKPGAPVIIVESEKTAVVCDLLMPEYVWLATGGAAACSRRRVERLEAAGYPVRRLREAISGRTVFVALDHDKAGRDHQDEVAETMVALGASPLSRVAQIPWTKNTPDGSDLADAVSFWGEAKVREVVADFGNKNSVKAHEQTNEFTDDDYERYDPGNDAIRVSLPNGKSSTIAARGGLGVLFGGQGSGKTRLVATAISHLLRPQQTEPPLTILRKPGEYVVVLDIDQETYSISRMMDLISSNIGIPADRAASYLKQNGVYWHQGDPNMDHAAALDTLKHYCSIDAVKVVVLDNLKRIVKNINDHAEAIKISAFLRHIAEETGTTILVIGHTNPGQSKLAGSIGTQLPQAAQGAAMVMRETPKKDKEESSERVMILTTSELDSESVKVRHGAPRRAKFVFDAAGRIMAYEPVSSFTVPELAGRVARAFNDHAGLSRKNAAERIGGDDLLRYAMGMGLVKREKYGNVEVVVVWDEVQKYLVEK